MMLNKKVVTNQLGFSLVELMVGLVIGLLATLVIMQVFATFEGQKRTTTGSADAQTNGSIALFSIQRDVLMAGFGLPVFDTQNPPLKCDPSVTPITVDHDSNAATPNIDMFPIQIIEGAGGASDTIEVRYATDGANAKSGVAVKIAGITPASTEVAVGNNLGCNNGDVVLLSAGSTCAMTTVNDNNLAADTTHITLNSAAGASIGASIACMGKWDQFTYTVVNSQLQRNDASSTIATPIVSDIVNMQAQYGVSAVANDNKVVNWVSASAPWDAPTVVNRNRIKAVHVAIVARNGLLEKDVVTTACTTSKGTINNGPCAWDDTNFADAAPAIDLSGDANWQHYRYRVYETIIPLRNIIWSKNTL